MNITSTQTCGPFPRKGTGCGAATQPKDLQQAQEARTLTTTRPSAKQPRALDKVRERGEPTSSPALTQLTSR